MPSNRARLDVLVSECREIFVEAAIKLNALSAWDFSCPCVVLDGRTDEIKAVAKYYGGAFVVPEVNNSGLAVVKYLLDEGVHVYQRRKVNGSTGMVEKAFGSLDRTTQQVLQSRKMLLRFSVFLAARCSREASGCRFECYA